MPMTENEETGARPIALHSSEYAAGVPIKKRRFPFVRPPSPPAKGPGSTTFEEEIKPHKKERSSTSQGSVISSDVASRDISGSTHFGNMASIASEQIGSPQMESHPKESEDILTAGVQGSVEEKPLGVIPEDTIFSDVKLEQPSLDVGRNMELHKNEKSVALHGISGRSELRLAESQGLKLGTGSETKDIKLGKSIDSSEKGKDLMLQKIEGNTDTQKVMEPFSLKLSLADEKCSFACTSVVTQSEDDGTHLSTNRSNWDLNTTMDAWEISVSETASVSVGSINTETSMGGKYDLKPLQTPSPFFGDTSSVKQNLAEGESRSTCDVPAVPTVEKCADYLNLDLGPPISQPQSQCQSQSSSSLGTPSSSTNVKLAMTSVSAGNVNIVASVAVKSEPVEEREGKSCDVSSLSRTAIKHELVEPNNLGAPQNSGSNTIRSVAVKNEPVAEVTQELPEARGTASDGSDKISSLNLNTELCTESNASKLPEARCTATDGSDKISSLNLNSELCTESNASNPTTCQVGTLVCPTEMDAGGVRSKEDSLKEADTQRGSLQMLQPNENNLGIASNFTPASLDGDNEAKVSTAEPTTVAVDSTVGTSEQTRQKLGDEVPPRKDNNEDYGSDGEKLDISAGTMEEDNYGSEYESDGNHDSAMAANTVDFNREDNEYEDGEVREQIVLATSEGHVGAMVKEHVNTGQPDQKKAEYAGDLNYQCSTSPLVENDEAYLKVSLETSTDCADTSHDDVLHEKIQTAAAADSSLQESLAVDSVINTLETTRTGGLPVIHNPLNNEAVEPGQVVGTSQDIVSAVTCGVNDNSITTAASMDTDPGLKDCLVSAKIEEPLNGEAVVQDGNPESNRRRIINLSRASNLSSPDKSRSFPDRSIPLPAGRKRLPDVALEGDKPHHRGRDDIRSDDFNRFSRERNHDMFSRNSRSNFSRDRGRVAGNLGDDWDAEAEFRSEMYNGRSEFRGRYKYAQHYRNYNVTAEGALVGSGRGGRKFVTDEPPNFRHLPSRRRSPRGRDGPNSRGLGIVSGVPRSMSPNSRCLNMDDSGLVGLRHGGKFVRDFTDDTMEPMYSYEEADGFPRGDRNIVPFKKVIRQIRSKSPIRLRNRSPIAWSSPRRRSPETFGHPELSHRRSPGMYRRDRMRSPERTCFHGEMMIRKQNSPAYVIRPLDDMREMNSGREHGFRPMMPNRSPSGRLPIRNRGYEMLNSRDRTHGEYLRMPVRTGRLSELGEDGNNDERRRLSDKRGPVRRFRAPYAAEDESFMYNGDDASRSYRLCNEDDSVFHEKGNSREGQLEGRSKNRQGDIHKTRRIEEQEGNYRHNGPSDEFEDGSRGKRKRF